MLSTIRWCINYGTIVKCQFLGKMFICQSENWLYIATVFSFTWYLQLECCNNPWWYIHEISLFLKVREGQTYMDKRPSIHWTKFICYPNHYCDGMTLKHLLRHWPVLARSSTLHFSGAVNTRQNLLCISIVWSLLSFQIGPVVVQGHSLAL